MHLGSRIKRAAVKNSKVHLRIADSDGQNVDLVMDRVISATGFQVSVSRLGFL